MCKPRLSADTQCGRHVCLSAALPARLPPFTFLGLCCDSRRSRDGPLAFARGDELKHALAHCICLAGGLQRGAQRRPLLHPLLRSLFRPCSALQVVPQLQLGDILALSQTAKGLRTLVQTGSQPASWAAAATTTIAFQPGASSTACYQQLQQLAASHAALRAEQPPRSVTTLSLPWEGMPQQRPAGGWTSSETWGGYEAQMGPRPDSSGRHLVSLRHDLVQVHSVAPGPQPQLQQLFSLPSPETSRSMESADMKACWAPDSSKVALAFYLRDQHAPGVLDFSTIASYETVHVVRVQPGLRPYALPCG